MSSYNETEHFDAILQSGGITVHAAITMNHVVVRNALSYINEHEYPALTTPGAVYNALLDLCGGWYSDLAETYTSEGSVAYEDEAAFDKAEAALIALQSALPNSEKGSEDRSAAYEAEYGLQGRGPDADYLDGVNIADIADDEDFDHFDSLLP